MDNEKVFRVKFVSCIVHWWTITTKEEWEYRTGNKDSNEVLKKVFKG